VLYFSHQLVQTNERATKEVLVSTIMPQIAVLAERLQGLDEREKLVLRLRFALDGSYNHTLVEIGAGLDIAADEVRTIERRALGKLLGER